MSIEETLDRLATNVAMIAGAISTLAEAVNGSYKGNPIYGQQQAAPPEEPRAPNNFASRLMGSFMIFKVSRFWVSLSRPALPFR